MTTLAERIPVDQITEQARTVKPGHVLLTVFAGVFFGLGWVTAKLFAVLWLAASWVFTAVRLGWAASHGPSKAARIAAMTTEIEELRTAVGRFGGP